ncbi:MAG: hypothetical protein FJ304_27215 [Planctomycetes bacterium]|nr:hypothetical protein [Planctomycetota bacterium]
MLTTRPLLIALCLFASSVAAQAAELVGVTVTPHVIAESMQYRRPRDPDLGAKMQLFVKGPAVPGTFEGKTPAELLKAGEWAWHDLATAQKPPDGGLAVWTFNGKTKQWGVGKKFGLDSEGLGKLTVPIEAPTRWISTINFLASKDKVEPDTVVIHLANDSDKPLRVTSLRWWLPNERKDWQVLWPQPAKAVEAVIPPKDRGFVKIRADKPFPLTYAAVEVTTDQGSLWEHLRVKREAFDIGGGWVADNLKHEPYLKLLSRLHINMGQIQGVPGYTDQPERYDRYPIKLCNRLWPLEDWDTDAWLPKIHAVEFLGEPQYGGGRPVPPQEVFDKLLPYRTSRLPTSVTHSEERVWRFYAGLSDYPHYDAYRVVAPAADAWRQYDRWDGKRISWGAPLETIGDMCRSLRELNRPMPCAYWSQGPHDGWGGGFGLGGRTRRSPTPDELRSQAVHALSTRITSLYWFNLSLKSLLKFPDTWEPITRVGREIRMLEPFFLEGDAYRFERVKKDDKPDWNLASVAAPEAVVLFANDLAYTPDAKQSTFVFGDPRPVTFRFVIPPWLRKAEDVFRVDADGVHEVKWKADGDAVVIEDRRSRDAIYIATRSKEVRTSVEQRRQAALTREKANAIELQDLEKLKK